MTRTRYERKGNFKTCMFDFEGIPNEHVVSGRVCTRELYRARNKMVIQVKHILVLISVA